MRVKSLQYITLFVVGVVVVFTLIFTRQYFRLLPAHGQTNNLVVFDDALSSGFANWSWNTAVDLDNANPVYSGTTSMSITPSAWGGLYFHSDNTIDLSQYASLQFAMQTTDSENNFTLIFYDSNNLQVQPAMKLSQFPGVIQNGWKVYTLPTTPMPPSIKGFAIQETSGNAGTVTYLDVVQFVAKQTAQTISTATSSAYPIYIDALASGWTNWSWNSIVDFSNTLNANRGADAIAFMPTSANGGLYVHTDAGVDTTPYAALTFTAKTGAEGAALAIGAYDSNNKLLQNSVSLNNYGGQPVTEPWKTYTVPLQDLNASDKIIKGFAIYDITGHGYQNPVYIDQLQLIGNQTVIQPASVSMDPTPTATQSVAQITPADPPAQSGNPLSGQAFFNDPDSNPAQVQAQQWQLSNPTEAALMDKIAKQPKAIWIGNWDSNVQADVQKDITKAKASNTLPIFVAYNIPHRDCGSYSAGGSTSQQAYQDWINAFAAGIGSNRAAIILEPDALAQITCLSLQDQQQRLQLLTYAVQKFKSLGQTAVYLDAAHSGWIAASDMAQRLKNADIAEADGFSLNVSNFDTNATSISYGQQISNQTNGKHFVIDTSRNGNGPAADNAWCNPDGRALGNLPTTQTGNSLVDAYIWIKYPGESDGSCNGAPAAGVWYPSYALQLAQNAKW